MVTVHHVALGICVPNVYNFAFLLVLSVEMAPKTKGRKGKRSKKDLWPEPEIPANWDFEAYGDEPDEDKETVINDKIVQIFEGSNCLLPSPVLP